MKCLGGSFSSFHFQFFFLFVLWSECILNMVECLEEMCGMHSSIGVAFGRYVSNTFSRSVC